MKYACICRVCQSDHQDGLSNLARSGALPGDKLPRFYRESGHMLRMLWYLHLCLPTGPRSLHWNEGARLVMQVVEQEVGCRAPVLRRFTERSLSMFRGICVPSCRACTKIVQYLQWMCRVRKPSDSRLLSPPLAPPPSFVHICVLLLCTPLTIKENHS